jgi:hypothetical protein
VHGSLQPAAEASSASQRSITVPVAHSSLYGLIIATVGGTIYSAFTVLFNIAVNDQFHLLPTGVPPLSVYCANFYFGIGIFATSALFNIVSMHHPLFSAAKSNVLEYLRDNRNRFLCLLAGFLAWLGDGAQFMGGEELPAASLWKLLIVPCLLAVFYVHSAGNYMAPSRCSTACGCAMHAGQLLGFSTALLVQSYPLVSTLLGIVVFREFWGCNRRAGLLLTCAMTSYAAAICLLMLSARNKPAAA